MLAERKRQPEKDFQESSNIEMSSPLVSRALTNALRQVGRSRPRTHILVSSRAASSKHPKGFVPPSDEDLVELRERLQEFTRKAACLL